MTSATSTARPTATRYLGAGLAVGLVTALFNLALWAIAAAAGTDVRIQTPQADELVALTVGPVVVMSVLPMVVGSVVLWLLDRRGTWRRMWVGIVSVVTVVSMIPLVGLGGGTANILTLALLHVAAGVAAAVALPRVAGSEGIE